MVSVNTYSASKTTICGCANMPKCPVPRGVCCGALIVTVPVGLEIRTSGRYQIVTGMGDFLNSMAAKRTRKPPSPASIAMHNALAENLRVARQEVGLTQVGLGELADVSKDYIRRIEKGGGAANVSIDVLCDLATHVNRTPLDLLAPLPTTRRRHRP
jgi:DNA-binding XRE family transcriptional regulator